MSPRIPFMLTVPVVIDGAPCHVLSLRRAKGRDLRATAGAGSDHEVGCAFLARLADVPISVIHNLCPADQDRAVAMAETLMPRSRCRG